MRRTARLRACAIAALAALATTMALGAGAPAAQTPNPTNCQNTGRFETWLEKFRRQAAAEGVSQATLSAVLDEMTLDPGIIARDRRQTFFGQSFVDFRAKLISRNRLTNGQRQMERHRATFARAEKEYGVPAAVITGFWALESDFGAGMGKLSVLRSLATLAYDCRRGEMFTREFIAALKIIDRGDLKPADMIGSWAGELGQTQFLPTHYLAHAVDYDGDGRRDLFSSPADVIGSTAAYLKHLGWRAGEPWLEEVRAPRTLNWAEADLAIQHPRSQWAKWGVTRADGKPLPADALPASLLALMGRDGPLFLAYDNFKVYLEWNQSLNYATTVAYLATRYAGAPEMRDVGKDVPSLSLEQVKELQTLLARRGHDVGRIDGIVGAGTRAAVKKVQLELGMVADAYPTAELLEKLRSKRGR
ncbi:MAG: lytic murein transglycosylase [Hyphomicrobiaceae bacterium]